MSKKAVYNLKGQKNFRLIIIGIQNKRQAINLLPYVATKKGWDVQKIRVQVKMCKA